MSKSRILFVDDESYFLEGLRHALHRQRRQWDMDFVRSVDEAMAHLASAVFDVIVVDISMPLKGGFELMQSLRERDETRDIPIIVLTGSRGRDLKRRALKAGASDLLCKPVDREDLVVRLETVLQLKRQRDEIKELNESLERKVRQRTHELEQARLRVIWRLAKAGEYRDEETGNHVARVACYSRALAEHMGLSSRFAEEIALASPLHDIGKIAIPDRILLKPGPLDDAERRQMQTHCRIGAEILLHDAKAMAPFLEQHSEVGSACVVGEQDTVLQMAARIAMGHHERWDGTGYPAGLAGGDIPVEARIVAVADVYDALRSVRPYKPAFDHQRTRDLMDAEAAGHFDPQAYAAFCELAAQFQAIWQKYSDPLSAACQTLALGQGGT